MGTKGLYGTISVLMLIAWNHPPLSHAQEPIDPVARTLRVQSAMVSARDLLKHNQPAHAVEILEQTLSLSSENASYLRLLREAYSAHLKKMMLENPRDPRIDPIKQRLLAIEGAEIADRSPITIPTDPAPAAVGIAPEPEPLPNDKPELPDPFQQVPLDSLVKPSEALVRAIDAFAKGQFPTAAELFRQAAREGANFASDEREAWAYCKLFLIVKKLNESESDDISFKQLAQSLHDAKGMIGSDSDLQAFANRVSQELARRQPGKEPQQPAPIVRANNESHEGTWESLATANFRIMYQGGKEAAEEVGRRAEKSRAELFQRWSGPARATWKPRCDLYLHPTGEEFTSATGKPSSFSGNARLRQRGREILARRLDLRLDDEEYLSETLPYQLTHLILADLYVDHPLPRWAGEAMAVLSLPSSEVARYLRSLRGCREQEKWIGVDQLIQMTRFPSKEAITPFYVESVSLVNYLVGLRGARHFALFLREAPRYGYEKALERQYGIRGFDDLEQRWLTATLGKTPSSEILH